MLPRNPELATLTFVMATAAQASDVEVVMGFPGKGAMIAVRCMSDHVLAPGFTTLSERIEGVTIVGAAAFVAESLSADQSLIY